MIILLVLAAVVVATPIAAAILVSMESLREDARHSLTGKAPSLLARAARRVLRVQPRGVGLRPTPHVPAPRTPESDDLSERLTGPPAEH
jgi:hypothetical protein